MGCLGKGMNQGGRNQCRKTEGKEDERDCSSACLAMPCAWRFQHVLSAFQTLFSCFPAESLCSVCTGACGGSSTCDGGTPWGKAACVPGRQQPEKPGCGWVCWLANSEPGQLETRIKGSGVRRIDCRDCISNTSS